MYFSEKVLVIRTGRFKEYDLWVRFLSPSKGILTGFAFGGCKSRKRFSGCLDALNLVLFKVSSDRRNRYLVLEEGSLIRGYPSLKGDSSRLGMAVNSLRFAQKLCPEGDNSSGIYSLMLDYLETMENNFRVPSFFPLLFRARAVFSHGFQPALNNCCRCHRALQDIIRPGFLFTEGKITCAKCRRNDDLALGTQRDSLLFLNNLNSSHPNQWLEWAPQSIILQDCFQVVESFVQYHLEDESYN
ncbi:MAG: DNA repair protein RecO [Desulfonatronovibrio sp.]